VRRMCLAIGISMMLGLPALMAGTKATSKPADQRWAAQNLKGTIQMVDPTAHLLIVRDPSGVPFDIKVTPSTRIEAGTTREQLSQLTPQESVSIHYVPQSNGDIGRTIQVGK